MKKISFVLIMLLSFILIAIILVSILYKNIEGDNCNNVALNVFIEDFRIFEGNIEEKRIKLQKIENKVNESVDRCIRYGMHNWLDFYKEKIKDEEDKQEIRKKKEENARQNKEEIENDNKEIQRNN